MEVQTEPLKEIFGELFALLEAQETPPWLPIDERYSFKAQTSTPLLLRSG
jgi:hypothetical protein